MLRSSRKAQQDTKADNGSFTIVISDHLVDEDMLQVRLAKILEVAQEDVTYTWHAGCYKIHNAPRKQLDEKHLDLLRL